MRSPRSPSFRCGRSPFTRWCRQKQLGEIKRALRLSNPPPTAKKEDIERADAEAKVWGPWYDGYEVQRKVTRVMPDGTVITIEDWPETKDPKDTSGNYKFEETYIDKIDTKKIADHFDEGYIPYFLKPDLMLSMPLPQLVADLKLKYPEIKLKDILDNIEKLKKANQKEIPASELAKQLAGLRTKSELYRGKTADNLQGLGFGETEARRSRTDEQRSDGQRRWDGQFPQASSAAEGRGGYADHAGRLRTGFHDRGGAGRG